jgi:hypothetical protein
MTPLADHIAQTDSSVVIMKTATMALAGRHTEVEHH